MLQIGNDRLTNWFMLCLIPRSPSSHTSSLTGSTPRASPIWLATGQRIEFPDLCFYLTIRKAGTTRSTPSQTPTSTRIDRRTVTFRTCQLLDQQQQKLFDFLRKGKHDGFEDEEIPVLPTLENRHGIDQADAIPVHKVYCDIPMGSGPMVLTLADDGKDATL